MDSPRCNCSNEQHCPPLCPYLSITEIEQEVIREHRKLKGDESEHVCMKYNKRIKHFHHHPMLPKLPECKEE